MSGSSSSQRHFVSSMPSVPVRKIPPTIFNISVSLSQRFFLLGWRKLGLHIPWILLEQAAARKCSSPARIAWADARSGHKNAPLRQYRQEFPSINDAAMGSQHNPSESVCIPWAYSSTASQPHVLEQIITNNKRWIQQKQLEMAVSMKGQAHPQKASGNTNGEVAAIRRLLDHG